MRIGIIVTASPANGGTYHYSIGVLNALKDYANHHEYVVFYDSIEFPADKYDLPNWTCHQYKTSDDDKWGVKIARLISTLGVSFFKPIARGRYKALCSYNLDLVICPSTTLGAWWSELPFIVAIHDTWHRHKLPGTWKFSEPFRDIIWRRAAKSAQVILVESETGKKEVIQAYHVPEGRIRILSTGPAPFIWDYNSGREAEVRARYDLPECYVFYPGGFSDAKNQKCVIRAVALIHRKHNLNIHAVFAGPLGQYGKQMRKLAQTEGADYLVHFLGLAPDEDMLHLYKNAICLVMASYIGPTNMPIWEAFVAGCPVISSNAGEMPEQVGDAGLIFDPSSVDQLVQCILKIYEDETLCSTLVQRGFKRVRHLDPKHRAGVLLGAIENAVR